MPDAWKGSNISGLMARGGFKIDIKWSGHKITKLVIHSSLGCNCRLRVNQQINSKLLIAAKGSNSNRFYQVMDLKSPIVKNNNKDLLPHLSKTWLFDLATRPGETYIVFNN